MIKVGIVGANGYTGLELMKLLSGHSKVKLTEAVSRSNAGTKICDMYPPLGLCYDDMEFGDIDLDRIADNCDVVFTALPHSASAELGGKLIDKGVKVIDLSADFRYSDIDVYEKTYKVKHPRYDLAKEAVYGLCEINRSEIAKARLVGNPGCYTTCSILALLPLIRKGLISSDGIIIDAKSGTSGAGKKESLEYSLVELGDNFKAYAVTTHRHTSEIEEKLGTANSPLKISFTPHLLPVKRGILATSYATLSANASAELIANAYDEYYKGERFVKVCDTLPELKWVVGSNMCCIGYKIDLRLNRIIIVSVIDNLVKGASGQAVQNMNIMLGFDESEGLLTPARYL